MKRFILSLLAIVLLAGLSGCSEKENNELTGTWEGYEYDGGDTGDNKKFVISFLDDSKCGLKISRGKRQPIEVECTFDIKQQMMTWNKRNKIYFKLENHKLFLSKKKGKFDSNKRDVLILNKI